MREEIIKFIEEEFLFGKKLKISAGDSFFDKGIIDSTGVLELILWVEEKYSIKIPDEEILPENFDSINAIEKYIRGKK